MPAPIAISRNRSELDSFGAPRVGSLTVGSGPSSYRESMAVSFGKDVSDIMDYSISKFCSSIDSDATAQPSTSLSRGLENTFCRNFTCCGQALDDLHDLLQHYEECHVRFEDDEMPGMVADDDDSSASSSQPPSPRAATASTVSTDAKRRGLNQEQSAFDTNFMRSSSVSKGKKRSFGQFSNGNNTPAVHQSLRRALIDGGVGRGTGRTGSSIYAANSPFSTPDSSIPGTPVPESDVDSAFFGGAGAAPAFSSLSLRSEDNTLPSCAPPNLFFPSNSGTAQGPPSKREKFNSTSAAAAAAAAAAQAVAGPSSPSLASIAAAAASAPQGHISRPGANLVVEKPFKCSTPGCDKAYKQMNGLKYHKLHGSCNRNNVPVHQIVADSAASTSSPLASPSVQRSVAGSPAPSSAPSSPRSSAGSIADDRKGQNDKVYLCQVGACGKRYRNLQGLRYHYLHSGSHGLLGQALLAANGGGPSARIDATTGRAPVNTQNMSADALASIAAQAHQQQLQQQAAAAAAAATAAVSQATTAAAPVVSTPPSPVKATVAASPAPTLAPAPAPAL